MQVKDNTVLNRIQIRIKLIILGTMI